MKSILLAKKKLKSENGASILFALLLFLLCIVVSTIVITAASTSAGRLADLAKMDQKYYLVNSVSDLIRNDANENTVVVEAIESVDGEHTTYTCTVKNIDGTDVNNNIIKEGTLKLFGLTEGGITPEAYTGIDKVNFDQNYKNNVINNYNVVLNYDEGKSLNAEITTYIKQTYTEQSGGVAKDDYSMIVAISDTNTDNKYSLITKYSADIADYIYVRDIVKPSTGSVIKETIKVYNVQWNLSSIEKG